MVATFVTPGLYVLRVDNEPEDDDMIVRSADGAVMRWVDVKRRWRSESGRQIDGVVAAVWHFPRDEYSNIAMNALVVAVMVFIAIGRWRFYPLRSQAAGTRSEE